MHHGNGTKEPCLDDDNNVDWDIDKDERVTKLVTKPNKTATATRANMSAQETAALVKKEETQYGDSNAPLSLSPGTSTGPSPVGQLGLQRPRRVLQPSTPRQNQRRKLGSSSP